MRCHTIEHLPDCHWTRGRGLAPPLPPQHTEILADRRLMLGSQYIQLLTLDIQVGVISSVTVCHMSILRPPDNRQIPYKYINGRHLLTYISHFSPVLSYLLGVSRRVSNSSWYCCWVSDKALARSSLLTFFLKLFHLTGSPDTASYPNQ